MRPHLGDLADDFMAGHQRERRQIAGTDRVQITAADSAVADPHGHVAVTDIVPGEVPGPDH
nr:MULTISPECIES: hypothetical protein [unclassified Actinopolyspora]